MSVPVHSRVRRRGFGLIETMACVAVVGVMATLALPSFRESQLRSRRVDATQSLQRLQAAQEQYRITHGRYAESLGQLSQGNGHDAPPADSKLGQYRLELRLVGDDGYEVTARPQGAQARDTACPSLGIRVNGSFSTHLPEAGCWPA